MLHRSAPSRRAIGALLAAVVLVVLATAIAVAASTWEVARPDGVGTPTQMGDARVHAGPLPDDHFGESVAVEGTLAVVGSPGHVVGSVANVGRATVYRWSRTDGWTSAGDLDTGPATAIEYAGRGLAVSGGHLFVGVPGRAAESGKLMGRVLVYDATGPTIVLDQSIVPTAPVSTTTDYFGWAIAVDGARMAVSAPGASGSTTAHAGAVYIYEKSGSVWALNQRIDPDDGVPYEEFGRSLDLDGDDLIVGSPFWDGGDLKGRVRIYRRDPADGFFKDPEVPTLTEWQIDDEFGFAVAVKDGLFLASAPGRDTSHGVNAGCVLVTRRGDPGETEGWTQIERLESREPTANEYFGKGVALSGDTILVSSRWGLGSGGARTGVVYRWLVNPSPYDPPIPLASNYKFYARDPGPGDNWFGDALAFDGDTALAGAYAYDTPGTPAGADFGAAWFFGGLRTATVRADRVLSVPSPGLLGNDNWTPGLTVTATIESAPAHGTATVGADGAWTYDPTSWFLGTDTFRYRLTTTATSTVSTVTVLVVAPPTMTASAVSIKSTAYSTLRTRTFNLTGVLKPGRYLDPVRVWVKKPSKSYWSYSSARLAYSITPNVGANWWYRYDPKPVPRGTYAFRASFAGDANRLPCWSGIIYVKIR